MTTTHDTSAALEAAIDKYTATAIVNAGALGAPDAHAAAVAAWAVVESAITAHVEAEVARRLAAAPGVEAAIVRHDDDTYWRGYRHGGGKVPPDWEDVPRDDHALRAAIAADKARAVEAAIEGTGRAEQFADAICHRVGARDSGCGGQTVEAGTARLYADAAKRIDDLIARDKARPTPDEARSIGRVAEHLRGLAADRVAALIEERPGPTEAMRALFAERRPCAGWVATEIGALVLRRSDGVGSHAVVHGQVWRTANASGSAPTLEAAQLACEDALRAVAAEILRAVGR